MSLACEITPNSVKLGMLKLTSDILKEIREGQKTDLGLVNQLVLINRGEGGDFRVSENGVIRFGNRVYILGVLGLKKSILEEVQRSGLSINPDVTKMYQDLKKLFWWPGMEKEVAEFSYACLICQKSKIEHHKPLGLMQSLSIPEWKWDSISMDFVISLPKKTKGCDSIWVIMDMLTKLAHFIPIKITCPLQKLVELYIEKIFSPHAIPSSIMSDRYPIVTSRFWESLLKALGAKSRLSSVYHPQTDGQTEGIIQSLEDLLRAYVLE